MQEKTLQEGKNKGDWQKEGSVARRAGIEEVGMGIVGTPNIQIPFLTVNLVNLGH